MKSDKNHIINFFVIVWSVRRNPNGVFRLKFSLFGHHVSRSGLEHFLGRVSISLGQQLASTSLNRMYDHPMKSLPHSRFLSGKVLICN